MGGLAAVQIIGNILKFKAQPVEDIKPIYEPDNSGLYIVGAILLIFGFIYFFGKGGKK